MPLSFAFVPGRPAYKPAACAKLIGIFVAISVAMVAQSGPAVVPRETPPLPSLVEFATANKLPSSDIQLAADSHVPARGDQVCLRITLDGDVPQQQWLAVLEFEGLSAQEKKNSIPESQTIFTSTGRELQFVNTKTSLRLSFVGPFRPGDARVFADFAKQLESRQRLLVNAEDLNAGLEKFGALGLRLAERCAKAGVKSNEMFYIGSSNRMSDADLRNGKRYVEVIEPTADEERTIFSVAFALNSLLGSALEVSAFKKVVDQVLIKPSAWSILKSFGVGRHLAYDSANVQRDDILSTTLGLPTYRLPMTLYLNGTAALEAEVTFTASQPPLEVCAGIVRIQARNPIERSRTLTIEILAARPAKA